MGLFQAVSGAIGGTLADQWLDFYTVPDGLPATAAVFPAVRRDENQGRGAKAGEIAKALDASLLHIHYLASFGLTSKPKRGWRLIAGTSSHASIQSAPVLLAGDTEWQINGPGGARTFTTSKRGRFGGAIYLDDPSVAEPDIFTMSESTSAADKKGDGVTNALGILLGSGTQKTKSFVSKPESEDAYKATFDKLIGETTAAFLQALGSAR